jgi:hypothetical protein
MFLPRHCLHGSLNEPASLLLTISTPELGESVALIGN